MASFKSEVERIDAFVVHAFVKFFERNIRREILLHDEFHEPNRLREDRVGGAKPDAVE